MSRYIYSNHRTQELANAALEHFFATGEISEAEHPRVERRGKWWSVTLPECCARYEH
jgi:hypothetical protein